jgi:anti-sigma regulatory factor (Ser/Thr protein kinase)
VSRSSDRLAGEFAEGPGEHVVHFYPAEDVLAAQVGRYLAEGIASGNGVLVVATAAHRRGFAASLAAEGVDAGRAERDGRLLTADASALLGSFLVDGRLDRDQFSAVAGGLIGRAAAAGRPVRIYAEMVALLWDAGDVALAIELEGLWNDLGARLPFSLLCGYPASVLAGPDSGGAVRDACLAHSAVADARSFTGEPQSVRAARHYVMRLLGDAAGEVAGRPGAGDAAVSDAAVSDAAAAGAVAAGAVAADAAIVVTELTANAVLHARSAFTLTVTQSAAGVRIAVRDNTPLPAADEAAGRGGPFAVLTGHGLSVVAQLASRWSVERLRAGKVVWAELGRAGGPVSAWRGSARPGSAPPGSAAPGSASEG